MTPATGLRAAALIAPALVLLTGCGHLAAAGASQPGSVATAVSPSPTTAASPAASASPSARSMWGCHVLLENQAEECGNEDRRR